MAAKKQEQHTAAPVPEQQFGPPDSAPETSTDVAIVDNPGDGALEKSIIEMQQEEAGAGLMGMGANDFAIPFISILQKGSPQVSRANSKYIKGAESGYIMNTVTQELYNGEEGIQYIPCGYNKSIVRWKPRDSGGGLVGHYREGDPILKKLKKNDRGQMFDEESGDIFVDTAYHFGLLLHEEGLPEWAVVSMYSTQLKASRTWNTTMRRIMKKGPKGIFNPPCYSHIYRLTTVGQTKDSYDWFGWNIVSEGEVTDVELYKMAREFSKQVEAGQVRVSAPPEDFEGTGDEVPF